MNRRLVKTAGLAWLAAGLAVVSWLGTAGAAQLKDGKPDKAKASKPVLGSTGVKAGGQGGLVFVGDIAGGPRNAKIVIDVSKNARTKDQLLAYVCSPDDAFNKKHSRWFRGHVAGNKLSGESTNDPGASIEGTISGNTVKGTVTVGKNKVSYSAEAMPGRGPAGLYRAEARLKTGEWAVAGWIVFPHPTQPKQFQAVGILDFLKEVVQGAKKVVQTVKSVAQKVVTVVIPKVIGVAKAVVPILQTVLPGPAKLVLVGISVLEKIDHFLTPLVKREPLNGAKATT